MSNEVYFIRARSGRQRPTQAKRFPTIEGVRLFVRSFIDTNRIICDVEQIVRKVETEGRVALSKGVLFSLERLDSGLPQH